MTSSKKLPKAKTESMIVRRLAAETLIYDLKQHRACCLNDTAARIWKLCDGQTTLEQARRALAKETGQPVSAAVILCGVAELQKARLLEKSEEANSLLSASTDNASSTAAGSDRRPGTPQMNRRALVKRLGLSALLIPVITTIVAPTALAAASCSAKGQPCGAAIGRTCCSGLNCLDPDSDGLGTCN